MTAEYRSVHSDPESLVAMILEHCPTTRNWDLTMTFRWIEWAASEGFILTATDENGERIGLVIVRPVFDPHLVAKGCEFDPEGDTYFIDLAIALPPKRKAIQCLAFGVLKRFGMRDKIAFQRGGKGPVIVVDAHIHRRKLLRTMREVTNET